MLFVLAWQKDWKILFSSFNDPRMAPEKMCKLPCVINFSGLSALNGVKLFSPIIGSV